MSIILDCFGTMVLFVTPTAVDLPVWIGLHGCGHPMSMRDCWWGTILQAAIKSAASSASAAEAMTNLIMVAVERTVLLKCGDGSSSKRKMCAPALLRDQVLLR
jgi:hypothetical protein